MMTLDPHAFERWRKRHAFASLEAESRARNIANDLRMLQHPHLGAITSAGIKSTMREFVEAMQAK